MSHLEFERNLHHFFSLFTVYIVGYKSNNCHINALRILCKGSKIDQILCWCQDDKMQLCVDAKRKPKDRD